jgi:hypothetical protein
MAWPTQVKCDCGFISNIVNEGMTLAKPQVYKIPVFIQSTGELVGLRFCEADVGLKDIALVEWAQEHAVEMIRRDFGDDAVGRGCWPKGARPPMRCPKCGKMSAEFVGAGF